MHLFLITLNLLFDNEKSTWSARCLSNIEILRCYSVSNISTHLFLNNSVYTSQLDDLLPSCTPINLRASITSQLIDIIGCTDDIL